MEPVDQRSIQAGAEGVYETIAIIAKRARQVNDEIKAVLTRELGEVAIPDSDTGEEKEYNYDKMRISKSFDKIHPVAIAIKEKLEGNITFRYRDEE